MSLTFRRGNADEIRDVLNSRMEKYETAKSQLQQCQLYREVGFVYFTLFYELANCIGVDLFIIFDT